MDEAKMYRLAIDPEFQALLERPDETEVGELDASLLDEGCRDAIVYWELDSKPLEQCPIIDGHTRYERCNVLGIPYRVVGLKLKDRTTVLRWMCRNQLGRRNVSEVRKFRLRSILYDAAVQEQAEKARSSDATDEAKASVVKQVAEEAGVDVSTINRDLKKREVIKKLRQKSERLASAMESGIVSKTLGERLLKAPDTLLARIEKASDAELRGAAKQALIAMDTVRKSAADAPIALVELGALEAAVGKVMRANAEALRACKRETWAKDRSEFIRLRVVEIYDTINYWKEDAVKRKVVSVFGQARSASDGGDNDRPVPGA
jgi:hypothetical protein